MKERVVKHLRLYMVTLASLGVLGAGVGGALAAAQPAAGGAKVGVASSGLGRILVNGSGRTLYLFEKDVRGKSACVGACTSLWPPLIASGKPVAIAGARGALLGTTRRADGRLQVTYNHHPLYTFFKDTKKGSTKGEGVDAFGAEWYAVTPAGAKIEKATPSSTSSAQAGTDTSGRQGAGGYGY
jgi:predicted lipoprotein with Yx(FWY)xxD motif